MTADSPLPALHDRNCDCDLCLEIKPARIIASARIKLPASPAPNEAAHEPDDFCYNRDLTSYGPCSALTALTLRLEKAEAEVEHYKGKWLRGSERHAHEMRAQHEHNQAIIRELTGGTP